MAKFLFVVPSGPLDERYDEYNDWYENKHLDEVLKVPGFVAAQRFELVGEPFYGDPPTHRNLAIYEIEAERLEDALAALQEEIPNMKLSDAFDMETAQGHIFRPTGPRHVANAL